MSSFVLPPSSPPAPSSPESLAVASVYAQLTDSEKTSLSSNAGMVSRHVRAMKLDVTKAVLSVRSTLAWRETFGVPSDPAWKADAKRTEAFLSENAGGKMFVRGTDIDGRAILHFRPRYETTFDLERNLIHLVYNLEKAIAVSKRSGHELFIVIIDYTGYGMRNMMPFSSQKAIIGVLQSHFPERLKNCFLINPPYLFRGVWTLISPFLDPVTLEKIQFITTDIERLREYVPAEHLPVSLGGSAPNLAEPFDCLRYYDMPLDEPVGVDADMPFGPDGVKGGNE